MAKHTPDQKRVLNQRIATAKRTLKTSDSKPGSLDRRILVQTIDAMLKEPLPGER